MYEHSLYSAQIWFQGIEFYTQTKTVTSLWKAEDATDTKAQVVMPTMR